MGGPLTENGSVDWTAWKAELQEKEVTGDLDSVFARAQGVHSPHDALSATSELETSGLVMDRHDSVGLVLQDADARSAAGLKGQSGRDLEPGGRVGEIR